MYSLVKSNLDYRKHFKMNIDTINKKYNAKKYDRPFFQEQLKCKLIFDLSACFSNPLLRDFSRLEAEDVLLLLGSCTTYQTWLLLLKTQVRRPNHDYISSGSLYRYIVQELKRIKARVGVGTSQIVSKCNTDL